VKAALVKAWGPPEDVVIEEVPDPEAGPGEAVVDIVAAAVNYPDVLIAANQYQISIPPPFIPGSEYAGTVAAVGDGVTEVKVGDRVHGGGIVGCFAEKTKAPAKGLQVMPDNVSFTDAAAYSVVYSTAYHTLRTVADVQPGDWVAVLGAAGGVGLATVELAQLLGAKVLAAASTDAKLAVCTERGAAAVVNYATEDLKVRMKELTDGGADVVIDPVGGRYSEEALRAMRPAGRFVTVGYASGEIPRIPLNLVLLKGVQVLGFQFLAFATNAPDEAERNEGELMALLAAGRATPHIGATFPLDGAAAALRYVADGRAIGKVVLDIAEGRGEN
jgi:NADPH:quinone reductase